jgi:hypothetical protein
MKNLSVRVIPNGTAVEVRCKGSWENGNWGVVRNYDGEDYHVAMNNDLNTALVFSRNEIVVKPVLNKLLI